MPIMSAMSIPRFIPAMVWLVLTLGISPTLAQTDTGAAAKWGYGYADLLTDLALWKASPYVSIDSIGASTQGRALYVVTVTDSAGSSDSVVALETPKPRIFMHARTHPSEVQSFHIAKAGIEYLISDHEEARALRRGHIFHIMPMYNPDGVEMGMPRQNARGIDIEGNWNNPNPEAEVVALRAYFIKLMEEPNPIEVALNLHSDRFNCTRFFFFHDSAGTSPHYTRLQQTFIGDVQSHFPDGIEAWHFVKSWTDGFKPQYPESWWWTNHGEDVMALTFEDANCPDASGFDKTARALVHGSADYIARQGVGIRLTRSAHTQPHQSRTTLLILSPRQGPIGAWGKRYNALGRRF